MLERGYLLSRRKFLTEVGLVAAGVLTRGFLVGAEKPLGSEDEEIEKNLDLYGKSAWENVTLIGDEENSGRWIIFPSHCYGDFYIRDAFLSALGLECPFLERSLYSLARMMQDQETGQVYTATNLQEGAGRFKNRDDETTLLFLIWSGLLGIVDSNVEKATEFILKRHLNGGWYYTGSGDNRYWADTFNFPQADVITYNQGLAVVALKFLQRMGVEAVNEDLVSMAESNYRSLFDRKRGFMRLSRQLPYQDASAIFPEALHRLCFGQGILDDKIIINHLETRLRRASVYYPKGDRLAGIKVICDEDGSFLSQDNFSVKELASEGDYQNGGYWPMWSLVELMLGYSVAKEKDSNLAKRYLSTIKYLLNMELGIEGRSLEFICLSPNGLGWYDPNRFDYSWNVFARALFRKLG